MQAKYGASGTLRDEIAGGEKAEVFASANMAHPQSLAKPARAARSCCSRATGCARWCGRPRGDARDLLDTMLRTT